ncbi:type IV toxin-antitoxin system AbiEi family antitoxin domain-containing protein [Angustibacter sp. McL0619]|uniref:type IV toxin-antitoxin system AbiEi family antitoxin domain-containing protein n=1 Tax=Angustibacter sp. McL0619 TaxID=3415676 RepID=UPI003CEDD88D
MTELLVPRLTGLVSAQHGVFSTAQALDAGVHPREIQRAVTTGEWVRLRRGVYAPGGIVARLDDASRHVLDARAAQLTLHGPRVFSHITAAMVHGLPAYDLDLGEVHVTRPGRSTSGRHEAGIWHHVGALPEDRVTELVGLPVSDLCRTALDVARVAQPASALVIADAACARGVTSAQLRSDLAACMDWPGARRASRLLPLADGRAESPGESIARWALHALDLAPDELQLPVRTDSGVFRVDFAWTRWRLVGEFDGKIKYGRLVKSGESPSDVAWRERQRELAIERSSWGMVRFGWADVHDLGRLRHLVLGAKARVEVHRRSA